MFSFLRSKSDRSPSTTMTSLQMSDSVSGRSSGDLIAQQESITAGTQDQEYRSEDEHESLLGPTFTKCHENMTAPGSQDEVISLLDQTQTICKTKAVPTMEIGPQFAEPSTVMESIESDRTFGPDLRKYLPSGDIPTYHRLKRTDRSSAPPEDLGTLHNQEQFRRLNYLDRFALDVLPPPTAPVYLQVLTYIQRFTLWCAKIEDQERWEKMTTYLGEKMERVWMDGMREGFIPKNWDEDPDIRARIGEEKLAAQEAQLKAQKKRPVDPRAEVAIDTKRGRHTSQNVITFGEIEEAGVSFDKVKQRIDLGDLSGGDSLMRRTLHEFGRDNQLYGVDWLGGGQCTAYNPRGRDLQAYCLWEVQQSISEMQLLERILPGFKLEIQRKNTRARIEDEQLRHDLCLALAMELDSKDEHEHQDENENENENEDEALEDADGAQAHRQDGDSEIEYQCQTELLSDDKHTSQHSRSVIESTVEVSCPDTHKHPPGQSFNMSREKGAPTDSIRESAMVTPPETPAKYRLKRSIGVDESEEEPPTKRAKQVDSSPPASQAGDIAKAAPQEEDFPIVDDADGYPTKAEILTAMPRDGWKFTDVVKFHKKDDTFAKLLRSVAYSDMEKGRWFPRNPQASAMKLDGAFPVPNGHHAYIVSMPYKSPLNPEDYTTQGVHNTKGFKWRYVHGTNAVTRAAAKQHVEAYVDSIIARDRRFAADPGLMPTSRHGGYEQICDPEDPDRTTTVHGIWDTKQGQRVPGNEWFYKGREGEWKPRVFFYQGKTKHEDAEGDDIQTPKIQSRMTNNTPTPLKRRRHAKSKNTRGEYTYANLPAPKFKQHTTNTINMPGAKAKAKMTTATPSSSRDTKRTMSMHEERKSRAARAATKARASYIYDEDVGSDGDWDPNA